MAHDEDEDSTPASRLIGRKWLGLDETGEYGLVRFLPDPALTNRHGTVQGGFVAAMLDSATGLRALAELPSEKTIVTKSLDTRFLKPARVGELTAKARIVQRTEREITAAAELADSDGVIVAEATARLRILDRK